MKPSIIFIFCTIICCQLTFSQSKKNATNHNRAETSEYQAMLKTWCDGIISFQKNSGPDDGGIFSPSHQFVNGRSGDAVYPLLTLYHLTKNVKYKTAAIKVYNWSERHVSQPDGSWTNEAGSKNNWTGITCFSTISLGETLRHHGSLLTAEEYKQWYDRLRKGGDYILSSISFETGDINYPIAASAALAVCHKVLGDEKYLIRAKEFADFGLKHFTANDLIWGEGVRGLNDTTAKGLRPIDIPYNMEESLPNLALYATLTGDKRVLDIAAKSLQAHLDWMLPDGGLDAGWCGRQYKWNYYGTATGDGPLSGFALLSAYDERFSEAAFRASKLRKSNTHNGILYGGADLFARDVPVFAHHTFSNAKGLAAAIDAGLPKRSGASLPNDKAYGVREWPEASVLQIGIGPWRASITTNDIASSAKRGGHPMGGALSMLWHTLTGPIAVASMNDYKTYEPSNMQKAKSDAEQVVLTPRLELALEQQRYSNIYDKEAKLIWFKKADSIYVKVNGHLRDVNGELSPDGNSAFEIIYTFKERSFKMAAHTNAQGTKLIFPVVSPSSEAVTQSHGPALSIHKKNSKITLTSSKTPVWDSVSTNRVFNYVPGFEAVLVQNTLDANGDCTINIRIDK